MESSKGVKCNGEVKEHEDQFEISGFCKDIVIFVGVISVEYVGWKPDCSGSRETEGKKNE